MKLVSRCACSRNTLDDSLRILEPLAGETKALVLFENPQDEARLISGVRVRTQRRFVAAQLVRVSSNKCLDTAGSDDDSSGSFVILALSSRRPQRCQAN